MDALLVRPMTTADIPLGMALKTQAGWNQVEADWRRMVELEPGGSFVANWEGVGVGTVVTCRFGPVAWIAMMLVEPGHRGRGIGRALMLRALEHLDAQGVRSVRLDATPLGRPLYETLGFAEDATILRHAGTPGGPAVAPNEASVTSVAWEEPLAALDRRASGADRGRLLERLADENPDELRVARGVGDAIGYVLARPGATAWHVGPCIADGPIGGDLLADALWRHRGEPVIVDIPEVHADARRVAEAHGLAVTRTLARMTRGPAVGEDLRRIWAGSGPEMG